MDPDRGHYRRLAKIKGLAAVFALQIVQRKTKRNPFLYFSLFTFSASFFSFSSRDFHPIREITFIRGKFFAKGNRIEETHVLCTFENKNNEGISIFPVSK